MHPNDFRRAYLDLLDSEFGIVDAADGYILLRKRMPGLGSLPVGFYDFVRVRQARPEYAYQIDFDGVVRFLGFTVVDDPRNWLSRVRTYWQVLRRPEGPLRPYPFFLNREDDIVEDTTQRPMVGTVWYPPSMWQAGDLLQLDTVPRDLGDEFSFCVGVLAGEDWRDAGRRLPATLSTGDQPAYAMEGRTWVRLHTFVRRPALLGGRLRPVRMADEARLPSQRMQVIFGDSIELLGYSLDRGRGPAGQERALTLYWRSARPVGRDYTIFVHVVADGGASLPQMDGGPSWRGPLATSSWHAGEVVPDTRRLEVPADAAAGRYRVSVGMYDWQSMERLKASDRVGATLGDEVTLTTIEVGR